MQTLADSGVTLLPHLVRLTQTPFLRLVSVHLFLLEEPAHLEVRLLPALYIELKVMVLSLLMFCKTAVLVSSQYWLISLY